MSATGVRLGLLRTLLEELRPWQRRDYRATVLQTTDGLEAAPQWSSVKYRTTF